MPTPFYHLSIADALLDHPALSRNRRKFLREHRPAFLLGKTAPDVQTISGASRESTHFFTVPLQDTDPAWERMLASYSSLAASDALSPPQAAFITGYLCHLQADQCWVREVFTPHFGPYLTWETFPRRLYLHNVLRAYQDRQAWVTLPDDIHQCLALSPGDWLPFVEVIHLDRWRDYLVQQLQPGGKNLTVEVFARRQGVSSEEFRTLLNSEKHLKTELFSRVPINILDEYRQALIEDNLNLIENYLDNVSFDDKY